MKEYKTKYAIGDLVYTANKYGYDRDVIKAIKITTLKETVKYGIKSKDTGDYYFSRFLYGGDGYDWYKTSEIFEDKESAQARYENLKAKAEAEEAAKKQIELSKRKAELKRQLKNLENGKSEYDDDDEV